MRVLVLGGSGRFGSVVAARLAGSAFVSQIALAGRNPETLARIVSEVGGKARSVPIDINDGPKLASAAANSDILVNAAGPEWAVLVPALRAAIEAGVDYCDLGADGRTTETQLALDRAARDRGIVAVVGAGYDPGLDNLLAVHASGRLDHVDDLQIRFHLALPDELLIEAIQALRPPGHVDASWQLVARIASGPVRVYRDGRWLDVEPLRDPIEIAQPEGGTMTAYPVATPEAITLPRHLPGVRSVQSVLSVSPPHVAELLFGEAATISRRERTISEATRAFLETVAADPGHWLGTQEPIASGDGWSMSVVVTGTKDGRRARCTCRLHPLVESTAIPLTVAALRILRREIPDRGVLPPEACFEPTSFFEEVGEQAERKERGMRGGEPLIHESFEWLADE